MFGRKCSIHNTYVPTRTIYLCNWQRKINTTLLGNRWETCVTLSNHRWAQYPTLLENRWKTCVTLSNHRWAQYPTLLGNRWETCVTLSNHTVGGHNIQSYLGIDAKHALFRPTAGFLTSIGGHNIQPYCEKDGKICYIF